ncbi:class I adenylate-forming enzyme family protein [Kibdelosporangium phytohabitans]|uniref:class I adenylate-forming enzyme family protein n=1 Tax=Kibdelosporangium phytohabitans TaxID=860235 RepID=UPI000A450379|nr:class I adenylate-forming enzyme family protein [Kibdelosporangium phytohabitans]MBE1469310.1 non-ribosomal peptide synthetase component E (peptide arylation enzyme) [Kibdelosporangium phytohabitans]
MTVVASGDLVPAELRARWAAQGYYAGQGIYQLFAAHVRSTPDRTAIIDDDGELTYAELDSQVRRWAAGLAGLGVTAGDTVATQLPNGRHTCIADLAVAAIGGVVLPYPVGRGVKEARSLLTRSGAVAAIVDPTHAVQTQTLQREIPGLRHVVVTSAPVLGESDFQAVAVDPDGPARMLVSSGSESEPKLVLYSHNALACGRGAFVQRLIPPGGELRALFLLPLASSFGSNGSTVTLARHGGTLVLQSKFDAGATLRLISRAQPTHLIGVPTMFRMMIDHPDRPATDLTSLRVVAPGGAQLDAPTAEACRLAFDCAVVNVYGSADGVNCHTALDDPPSRVTSAGRPNPAVAEIVVADDHLRPQPAGAVGEIIARGPMSPMRYVGNEDLNARYRTPDGWVRTGDLGVFDEDGYLTVVGRRKDVVIRGGANISPAEVEQAISAHPAVRDVACVGVPDPLMGERLCACVVASGTLTLEDVTTFLGAHGLDRFKHPERLLLLDSLPLNPAGKVAKDVLRAQATA